MTFWKLCIYQSKSHPASDARRFKLSVLKPDPDHGLSRQLPAYSEEPQDPMQHLMQAGALLQRDPKSACACPLRRDTGSWPQVAAAAST